VVQEDFARTDVWGDRMRKEWAVVMYRKRKQ